MKHRQPLHKYFAPTAGLTSAIIVILLAGITPSYAEEPAKPTTQNDVSAASNNDDVSAAGLHNGYYIHNNSHSTLILESDLDSKQTQPYKNGWGKKPPTRIEKGEIVYFEVAWWPGWPDDSTLVYKDTSGTTVTLNANVYYSPASGDYTFNDESSCKTNNHTILECSRIKNTRGRGEGNQTHFIIRNGTPS